MCTTLFSVLIARNLYTPLTKVSKQLLQLPGTAKNNILTHPGNFRFYYSRTKSIDSPLHWIRNPYQWKLLGNYYYVNQVTKFQLKHGITNPIWTLDHSQLSILFVHNNLSASILKRMRQLDFAFEFNGDIQSWSIPGLSQDLFHLICF